MTPLVSTLFVAALALASAGLGTLLLCHAVALWRAANRRGTSQQGRYEAALSALQASVDELAARIEVVELRPAATGAASPPRLGLNLGKRSQALRMHRRGDSPEQIAAALELPRQEVDLLLKVHRIVLASF
jgi:hypothetical protein